MAKRLLITGASGGIGRAIAEALLPEVDLLVVTGRNRERLDELSSLRPGRVLVIPCDLTDLAARSALVDRVSVMLPPLDGLVHCAGGGLPTPIQITDSAEFRRLFELHVVAMHDLVQAVLPGMVENRQGRILALSSLSAIRPRRYMTAYASTKAALRCMTQCIADEVAPHGITANLVCPGAVETNLGRTGRATLDGLEGKTPGTEMGERIRYLPVGRPLLPQDVVPTVMFLLSSGAATISGQDIVVAGTSVLR